MILFTILLTIAVILGFLAFFALVVGGVFGVIVFGDLFVCILGIVFLMKKILRKRR